MIMKNLNNYITEKLHLRKGIKGVNSQDKLVVDKVHHYLSNLHYEDDDDYKIKETEISINVKFIFPMDRNAFKQLTERLSDYLKRTLRDKIEYINVTQSYNNETNKTIYISYIH